MTLPLLVLFDMDGTLCNDNKRRPDYVSGNWAEYWKIENMLNDDAHAEAIDLYMAAKLAGNKVGVLTARQERNREVSEFWLRDHNFDFDPIILRPEDLTYMRPHEFKPFVMTALLNTGKYSDIILYDDDKEVCDAVTALLGADRVVYCTWNEKEPV